MRRAASRRSSTVSVALPPCPRWSARSQTPTRGFVATSSRWRRGLSKIAWSMRGSTTRSRSLRASDVQIYTTPSWELAQLPAAPGANFAGGCWKELPELLRRGKKGLWSPKNADSLCFRYCVMADLLGCRDWGNEYRKDVSCCNRRPFYNRPNGRPSKVLRLSPADVYVNEQPIDFSMLPRT